MELEKEGDKDWNGGSGQWGWRRFRRKKWTRASASGRGRQQRCAFGGWQAGDIGKKSRVFSFFLDLKKIPFY